MECGHCLVTAEEQGQLLLLCSCVTLAGFAGAVMRLGGVSEPFVRPEKTTVGFGLSMLAVGAFLAMLCSASCSPLQGSCWVPACTRAF